MRLLLPLILLLPAALSSQSPAAATIMSRVAANQDKSETARTHYLYVQHADVISRKGKTIRCEEKTDSRIVPTPAGFAQKLLKLDGRLLGKHGYQTYTQLPDPKHAPNSGPKPGDHTGDHTGDQTEDHITINVGSDNSAMDRDLVENMRADLTRRKTKDGIGAGLFPLTSKSQVGYQFHLLGREQMNGREVFHLTFAPNDNSDFDWKGDAYIDSTAYQPVVVRTTLSRKVPFAVRTLLGTNLPGLGFTVIYSPEPGGVWFPVSFGTEFKIKVLFFFHREIILSAQNREFEQTHVTSTILPAAAADWTLAIRRDSLHNFWSKRVLWSRLNPHGLNTFGPKYGGGEKRV